jgi:hypothetical protein
MSASHLILVPGHAVWSGEGDAYDSRTWFLNPLLVNEPAFGSGATFSETVLFSWREEYQASSC